MDFAQVVKMPVTQKKKILFRASLGYRHLDYAKGSAVDKRNGRSFLYHGISLFKEEQTPKYSL